MSLTKRTGTRIKSATAINRKDFNSSEAYEFAVIATVNHFDPFTNTLPCWNRSSCFSLTEDEIFGKDYE